MSQPPVAELPRPVIGISCGDLNGIGIELIIKTVSDQRILEICTPVIFASNKAINFYKKSVTDSNFNFFNTKDFTRLNAKQVNIYNCWEEEVAIQPGQLTEQGGKYAVRSLMAAVQALKAQQIGGLVTAPIHKKNVQSAEFNYTGHTPFLQHFFGVKDVLMLMVADNMRVGLGNRTPSHQRGGYTHYSPGHPFQTDHHERQFDKRFRGRQTQDCRAGAQSPCRR